MNALRRLGAVLIFAVVAALPLHAQETPVLLAAVAANFTAPMKLISAEFEKATGYQVLASFGSTGKFYAQIKNGAPFDVLLTADEDTPPRLISEGAAVAGTAMTYAIGKLVLWSAQADLVDASGTVLKTGNFAHLSLADPKLAPYGAAAIQAMKSLGVYERLQPRVVTAENITQAYQFVRTGSAELGFVALSQVLQDGHVEGSSWQVPATLYRPIRQDAVVLERGRGKPAALAFMKFLKGERAKTIIQSFGYEWP